MTVTHLKTLCSTCGGHVEYPIELAGQTIACPHCHDAMALPALIFPPAAPTPAPLVQMTAEIVRQSKTAGAGCLVQCLGLLCFLLAIITVFSVIGPLFFGLVGLILLVTGGNMARWFECSACGGKVSRRGIDICPHCRARIVK